VSSPDRFVSYAQHGEDVILWRALGDRPRCFYVDVGAFDPTSDSVTRALYERGWRGINIEPQPDRLAAFEEARPEDINLSLAIGDRDGRATLWLPPNPGWATTLKDPQTVDGSDSRRVLEVRIRRLDTLLPELGIAHVDVLKIDVEGTEPAVIRGLLGGPIRPLVSVVEGLSPRVGRTAGDEAVSLLVDAGYIHCLFDGLNHYLTTEVELQAALSVPANPSDEYSRWSEVLLERDRHQLISTIATVASENLGLRSTRAAALAQEEARSDAPRTPPATAGDSHENQSVTAETPKRSRDQRALDPATRSERRRLTFQRAIRANREPLNGSASSDLLSLAVTELPPNEAVALLYSAILGRDVDREGLLAWANRLRDGDSLLELAHELAQSPEAIARPSDARARLLADLDAWTSLSTLRELGVSAAQPGHKHSPGHVHHEIFVEALYEVAFARRPEPDEMRVESAKLLAGGGREWLLRSIAERPEVRARFIGAQPPGLLDKLRRWRDGRRYIETIRDLVIAAEDRHINHLFADVTAVVPERLSRLADPVSEPEDH
jgi:FkbM family methyltransferase